MSVSVDRCEGLANILCSTNFGYEGGEKGPAVLTSDKGIFRFWFSLAIKLLHTRPDFP